jgi:hypothetical protein
MQLNGANYVPFTKGDTGKSVLMRFTMSIDFDVQFERPDMGFIWCDYNTNFRRNILWGFFNHLARRHLACFPPYTWYGFFGQHHRLVVEPVKPQTHRNVAVQYLLVLP